MIRALIIALLLSLGESVMAVADEKAPVPRERPNPYEWKPEWGPIWERGEEWPPEMEAWFKEQRRIDLRDPEHRKRFEKMVEKKRQEYEAFKKRYEGWAREAQEAFRPGTDI